MTSTTNTSTGDFTAVLDLPAQPDTVTALFTSAAGVSRWWGPTEGDAAVGGTLAISFGEHGVNTVRVVQAGPSRVVWEIIASNTSEWLGTRLEFEILPSEVRSIGSGTELRFRHAGLTPQLECWNDCFAGWNHFMASITTFAETGTGTPFGS